MYYLCSRNQNWNMMNIHNTTTNLCAAKDYVLPPPASHESLLSSLTFHDACTNFVYISDKLKVYYPGTFNRLVKLFGEMDIKWDEVKGTKDIWIRDYMPIQLSHNKFLTYDYAPDYLLGTGDKYRTDSRTIYKDVLPKCFGKHYECINANIILDGGNFVSCGPYRLIADKVFRENYGNSENMKLFLDKLGRFYFVPLPWSRDNSQIPNADVYGHADGLVRYCSSRKVLMSNLHVTHPKDACSIKRRLENIGFYVVEMKFDVPCQNDDYNWAYINYLHIGTKIIVPTFGIAEDKQALRIISEVNPDCIVRGFRMRNIADNGGALHCITWNIYRTNV